MLPKSVITPCNNRCNNRFALLLFVLLFANVFYATAQQKSFRLYTKNDGLISNHIQSIFQDEDGFIWFANFGGISIYDGHQFINYTAENGGISDNIVFGFFKKSKNETWVIENSVTEVFVNRKRVETISIKGYESGNLSNYLLTKEGKILVGRGNRIYEIKDAKPQPIAFFAHRFTKIIETGNYFLIESDSLFIVNKSFDKILGALKGKIFKDHYNRLWILDKEFHLLDTIALQHGIFRLLPAPLQLQQINVKADEINDFLADGDDFYWLLSEAKGVMRIDKDGNTRVFNFNPENLISINFIEDAEGNVWIPIPGKGAIKFFNNYIDVYTVDNGLPSNFITSVAEDASNHCFWLASKKGISCIYHDRIFNFPYPVKDEFTWASVRVQKDSLWLAFNGIFLYKIFYIPQPHLQLLKHWRLGNGNDDMITGVLRDTKGALLMNIEHHGLYRETNDGKLQKILPEGLGPFLINRDELWTGSKGDGVARWKMIYENTSLHLQLLQRYQHLPDDNIFELVKDSAGNFWMGTLKKGILKFENQKNDSFIIRNYFAKEGLINGWVMRILMGSKKKVYVGTLGGLFELHESGDSTYFENLSRKYGLTAEIYDVIEPDAGNFWIATDAGVLRLRRNQYHKAPPPKVFFSGMISNNQPDSSVFFPASAKTFSYKENNLAFQFSATSFQNEDQVLYSYKLDKGQDSSQWSAPQKIHTVSLLSLSPGSYTLKVKALTQDNVLSEVPARYSFNIKAPFWSTWWFRTLIVLFVAALVAGFYKFRLNQLRKVMAVRTKISRDLHDEIGSTLSGIGLMSEMVKGQMEDENYKAVKNSVNKISTSSEEILGKMSDIVWAINPQNDTFEKMIRRLQTYATSIAAPLGIHLYFESEKELQQMNLGMQERNNIYLICKEAINNAIKYSECHHLNFALRNYDQLLQIDIKDDGKGFDIQQIFDGNGLKNMQSRADEIKAALSIASEKNKGTSIKLQFKII